MAQCETTDVLDTISRHIAEELDRPIRSFTALLTLMPTYSETEKEQILPFAEVALEVLENLGAEYAEFAQEQLSAWRDIGNQKLDKYDFSDFPPLQDMEYESSTIVLLDGIELQTQQFEVAEIVVEDKPIFQAFEFVTAKLERRKKTPGRFKTGLFQKIYPSSESKSATEWIIGKQTREAQRLIEKLSETVILEMVLIPSGKFLMGATSGEKDSKNNEQPQHKVTFREAFLMGRYPITQEQWKAVVALPRVDRDLKVNPSRFKGDKRPVEQVSWLDTLEFCNRLTQYTDHEYRLPSEAEWEYACRAGTKTPFYYGETINTELANYDGNRVYGTGVKGKYREATTEVGEFPANKFGLCDMHGQVWEWCADDWHDNYENDEYPPKDGATWVLEDNATKVMRGGSWVSSPSSCRSACRKREFNDHLCFNIGFRVVFIISGII